MHLKSSSIQHLIHILILPNTALGLSNSLIWKLISHLKYKSIIKTLIRKFWIVNGRHGFLAEWSSATSGTWGDGNPSSWALTNHRPWLWQPKRTNSFQIDPCGHTSGTNNWVEKWGPCLSYLCRSEQSIPTNSGKTSKFFPFSKSNFASLWALLFSLLAWECSCFSLFSGPPPVLHVTHHWSPAHVDERGMLCFFFFVLKGMLC